MATLEVVADAKVATLVSDRQIAINAGSAAGVREGDMIRLFRRVEIVDPDSRESLGTVKLPKLALRVILVNTKYSLAEVTSRVESDDETGVIAARVFRPARFKRIQQQLPNAKADEATVFVVIGEDAEVLRRKTEETEPTS